MSRTEDRLTDAGAEGGCRTRHRHGEKPECMLGPFFFLFFQILRVLMLCGLLLRPWIFSVAAKFGAAERSAEARPRLACRAESIR